METSLLYDFWQVAVNDNAGLSTFPHTEAFATVWISSKRKLLNNNMPVSYTHLDVYKRQLSLLVGVRPAHEHKCFAEGKASILVPISEIIPMAVKSLLIPCLLYTS